ncbi:MAG TPA: N-acetyltransferase [Candidatus Limnocylindrales bacterium]|nr:N-acetyltransferase [Candidatus Limnocylindrales bacterium]
MLSTKPEANTPSGDGSATSPLRVPGRSGSGGPVAGLGGRIVVSRLDPSSYREAVEVLALSWTDEPAFSHLLRGTPRRRLRVLGPFLWSGIRSYPDAIEVHGARLDGRLVGVGVRYPPGRWPVTRREELRGWVWGTLGMLPMLVAFPQARRLIGPMTELQGRHPRHRPHWYLWCMGVHPSFRRRGVASALARFVTAQADAAGVGCYAETFGNKTEALYRGFGFVVHERLEMIPGAPMARTMWREPRPDEPVTDGA